MTTAPLTPPDCDLTNFGFMQLDVVRLRDSRIVNEVSGEEFRAAVLLWCASWHQVPAASLPDDDSQLAKFAGYGRVIKEWLKVRPGALHGWVKCDDGRLYHPTVAEKANEAWKSKLEILHKREEDRKRKAALRDKEKEKSPADKPPRSAGNGATFQRTNKVGPLENALRGEERRGELQAEVPSDGHPPDKPPSEIATLMARTWAALGVADATGLPPNLSHKMRGTVEALIAENCDFFSDIAPALSLRPQGNLWPQSAAFWVAIARSNRDKRVAARASKPPQQVEIAEWSKRIRVWSDHQKWDRRAPPEGWGPAPGEPGCLAPAELLQVAA